MSNIFMIPHRIISGDNALGNGIDLIDRSIRKVLLVTDSNMLKFKNLDPLLEKLRNCSIEYALYAEINSEPTDSMIYDGLKAYRDNHCQAIIALGGGSPLDAAKLIAIMLSNHNEELYSLMGREIDCAHPFLALIPTTAGTGSEATQFAVVTDTKRNIKMLLRGPALMPDLAIVDPLFTISTPPSVTANTGIDALTHALEAYTSKKAQPLSDTFALSAIDRIFKNLLRAYKDGSDIRAREQMALAALEAGIAFNNSSVTLIHGMSRPVGALFHVPHGLSNAMLLGPCLDFIRKGAQDRLENIALFCGLKGDGTCTSLSDQLIDMIQSMLKELDIKSMQSFGIDKDEFYKNLDKMALDAINSKSPASTRCDITKDDIIALYKKAYDLNR